VDVAASGVTACLRASFSAEDDCDVGSDAAKVFLLIHVEADAEADEKNDRGDAPHDAEHGQEAAKLRLPERRQRLLKNLVERHGGTDPGTRIELLPRIRNNPYGGSVSDRLMGWVNMEQAR
jgi:hypothetical protein